MRFIKFKADEALAKHVLTTEEFSYTKELPPSIGSKVIGLKRARHNALSTQPPSVQPDDMTSEMKLFDQGVCWLCCKS